MPRNSSSNKVAPLKHNAITPNLPAPYPQMTLGKSIQDGIGLGVGSAIGHRIIGALFPTNSSVAPYQPSPPQKEEPCAIERSIFESCILNEKQYFCHEQQTTLSACLKSHASLEETK